MSMTGSASVNANGRQEFTSIADAEKPERRHSIEVVDEEQEDDDGCCPGGFCIKCPSDKEYWVRKCEKFFPITDWLRRYNCKQNLIADILVGITVAIFQVPQSMGYCLIANVPPVHGLYTAFFPPLIYAIFGTSRHCSVGAFALVSGVMTGHLVQQVSDEIRSELGSAAANETAYDQDYWDRVHVNIATSASLSMGIVMTLFGILRLGFVSIYFSSQSIGGFCCAASIYVFTSQLGHLTGIHLKPRSGFFAMPLVYYDVFKDFKQIHTLTAVISVLAIALLALFKCYLNPKFLAFQQRLVERRRDRKTSIQVRQNAIYGSNGSVVQSLDSERKRDSSSWTPLPFPIELLVVILMTVASNCLNLKEAHGVAVVGEIKQGMPEAVLPSMDMMWRVFLRSLPLAVVGYAITLSIGRLFGGKHGYTVDPNQELTALGFANLTGSCFGCLPSAASLPRSAIQENTGGKTQLVSLVNCAGLLVVILLIGSLLEKLPNCILASIISVALLGLISQAKDLKSLWKVSAIDGLQWLVSFLAVMIFDVDVGLYVGTGFSLLVLIYKSSRPKTYLLGSCDSTAEDVYVPIKFYRRSPGKEGVRERVGIKVYQFCGPLHFSSKDFFKRDLLKHCSLKKRSSKESLIHHVIIDCSMFSYIDSTGLAAVKQVVKEELGGRGITAFLASCAPHVIQMMSRDEDFFSTIPPDHVFVSVHDAVLHAMDHNQPIRVKNNNISRPTIARKSMDSGLGSKPAINRKGSD
jgi:MFS superfamily sulfate permease-like transporter